MLYYPPHMLEELQLLKPHWTADLRPFWRLVEDLNKIGGKPLGLFWGFLILQFGPYEDL